MTPDMAVKLLINAAEKNFKSDRLAEALVLANVANEIDHPKFEGSAAPYLAAYRVHAAAGRRKSGGCARGGEDEIDWRGVLGIVDAHPDIDTILGRYQQLADLLLVLHPEDDKYSSAAAEGAIVLVSEACIRLLKSQSSLRKSVPESASDQAWVRRWKKEPRGFSDVCKKRTDGRVVRVRVRQQRRPITSR